MSGDLVDISIDGRVLSVTRGSTVAAVMLNADALAFRASPTGETRAPLCGMGICFECRVVIDGIAHQRACMTVVRDGMTVVTAGAPA